MFRAAEAHSVIGLSERSNFGAGEPQTAAGIYTTTKETVHKSTFALMGHAVSSSALPRLPAFPLLCGRYAFLYSSSRRQRKVKVY